MKHTVKVEQLAAEAVAKWRKAMDKPEDKKATGRPFVSIHFECCGIYARAYLSKDGTRYETWCPKCARKVTIKVGPGGSDCRSFRAG